MLIAYASFKMQTDSISDMNEALRILVNGRETNIGSWMPEDMELVFQALLNGKSPDIDGATGSLEFDEKVYTNVLHSVYANWMVYEGKFLILDYNTSDGGKRTEETLAGWNWKNSQIQDFDPNQGSYNYPELQEQWAVLIAASQGWDNYRHQADVLEVYRILKKHGFTDDHIIMIMADDIAYNPQNPEPGIVRVRPDGENLYENIQIDYLLSDLSPDDLQNILEGKGSERLTQVVPPSEHNNIFLFWSGHGEPGEMLWRNDESLTEAEMRAMLNKLNEQRVYRKMLWMVETCYSGSVAKAAEGIPGILFITAADENETSKADFFSNKLRVWMSNRFTATFQERISENPAISLRDLYYSLFQNTVGSHVMVYNNTHFDNIYQSYMDEFIQRK